MPRHEEDDDDGLDEREFPDESDMDEDSDVVDCPYCGKSIAEEAEWCHHCGQYLSREDAPPKPVGAITLALIAIVAIAMLAYFLR